MDGKRNQGRGGGWLVAIRRRDILLGTKKLGRNEHEYGWLLGVLIYRMYIT